MSKVWFVTGSSRGLGREIVEAALNAGDKVVATARKPEQLNDFTGKFGDRVLALALDVTNSEEVANVVAEGFKAFGRYDVVVNNAGYGDTASVEDTTVSSFEKQIATNFLGVVYVTKAVLPILRGQGSGHIFQVSSLGGRVGSPGLSAYQSAKWAVGGFSTVLAQEVAPLGIKITVLEPGGMKTDWSGSSMTIPPVSAPYQQTVGAFAKMIRDYSGTEPTDPAKVAQVVLKLANRDDAPVRLLLGTDAVTFPISVDFARRTFGFAYICRQGRVSHSVEEAFITWKMGCTAKSIVGRRWPMPGTPFEVVYFVDCQADKKLIPPKGIGSATL